ncbi:hypothetical protein PG993_005459 [Apiospora rasikravindrae]|uniref:Nucleoside 2-deoxyribosyltransferase n=1 Tax=Apiospora rasikravindrae TaxID=990691 RepID=A0ABR1TFM9_9PEZI
MSSATTAQVVQAPAPDPASIHPRTIFLAGTTTATNDGSGDWRDALCTALSAHPITFYNPLRSDWDASWRNDAVCAPFREQTQWELDRQTRADLVVVYLGPHTDAPVSLLELGLVAGLAAAATATTNGDQENGKKKVTKQVLVCAHEGYKKRGNVQLLCQKFGIEMVDTTADFPSAILRMLGLWASRRALDQTCKCGYASV